MVNIDVASRTLMSRQEFLVVLMSLGMNMDTNRKKC